MPATARRRHKTNRCDQEAISISLSASREQGFALILVIWGLGIIALIASSLTVVERYRVQATANLVNNAEADALAEAGVVSARLSLASALQGGSHQMRITIGGPPIVCSLPADGNLAVSIEDEGGKVDINAASPELLSALLKGIGLDDADAGRMAKAIVAFAHPASNDILADVATRDYAADHRPYGPKEAAFESIFELDQVLGMRSALLRALAPYITVHAHKGEIDPQVASPILLAMLSGSSYRSVDPHEGAKLEAERAKLTRGVPAAFLGRSTRRSFLVHSEVLTADRGFASREAIVELTAGSPPDVLREVRRGETRYAALLSEIGSAAARRDTQPCLP